MSTLTFGFADPAKTLAVLVGSSSRFSFWTRVKLMIGATLNCASAILLLYMSRLSAIVTTSAAVVYEHTISIELANSVIIAGFFRLVFSCYSSVLGILIEIGSYLKRCKRVQTASK